MSLNTVKLGIDDYEQIDIINLDLNLCNRPISPKMHDSSVLPEIFLIGTNIGNTELVIEIKEKIEKKEKILIVDDNYYNSEATKNIIKKILKEVGSYTEIIIGSDGVDIYTI